MVSRFNFKRRIYILPVIGILFILVLFRWIISKIINIKLYKSNSNLVTYVLTNNNHLLPQTKSKYLSDLISFTTSINIKEPVSIVKNTINFSNYYLDDINNFLNSPKEVNNPIVYLYSSNFDKELVDKKDYKVNSSMLLIYILKGLLDKNRVNTSALKNDLTELINLNNIDSYEVSKLYLKEALNKYNLKLCLDIQIGDNESIVINNKKYAKINFVKAKDYFHDIGLITIVSKLYPELISEEIEESNSLNYDLSDNVVVLRIGSENSSLEEIYNTFNILSSSIKKWLGDTNG